MSFKQSSFSYNFWIVWFSIIHKDYLIVEKKSKNTIFYCEIQLLFFFMNFVFKVLEVRKESCNKCEVQSWVKKAHRWLCELFCIYVVNYPSTAIMKRYDLKSLNVYFDF